MAKRHNYKTSIKEIKPSKRKIKGATNYVKPGKSG
jgi:hypothetical protein